MNVVLDTNIVVSAFLSPAGKPAAILQLIIHHDLDICFNNAILAEYEQVLCRPKFTGKIFQTAIQRFFELINDFGVVTNCIPSHIMTPDETDRKFYDVAFASSAILITGNKKHFPIEPFIQDPAEFLKGLVVGGSNV
jgi:putative PIN family toxin of toxin-antitoxin system